MDNKGIKKEKINLSVCIPTRNRARFLAETLESVISQADERVEIVIVDGASTDNTREVVRCFHQKFDNIVYYRLKQNSGVDRDMARAIELASGVYCWMLSDDDALKPGAIKRMLNEIESECEIYLSNVTACSLTMKPLRDRFWLSLNVRDKVFDLHDKNEIIEYCNSARSIGSLFSYMSSVVLRREEWNKTGYKYDFDRSAYALAASLLSFTKRKCRLKYIKDPLVLWRNDNESFQNAGGLVKRFLLDFDGYLKLADRCLRDDQEIRNAFLKVMTREHPWYTIIHVASFIDNSEEWNEFRAKMFKFGYRPEVVKVCCILARNRKLVSVAVAIKRGIVKSHWVQKIVDFIPKLNFNNNSDYARSK